MTEKMDKTELFHTLRVVHMIKNENLKFISQSKHLSVFFNICLILGGSNKNNK